MFNKMLISLNSALQSYHRCMSFENKRPSSMIYNMLFFWENTIKALETYGAGMQNKAERTEMNHWKATTEMGSFPSTNCNFLPGTGWNSIIFFYVPRLPMAVSSRMLSKEVPSF